MEKFNLSILVLFKIIFYFDLLAIRFDKTKSKIVHLQLMLHRK